MNAHYFILIVGSHQFVLIILVLSCLRWAGGVGESGLWAIVIRRFLLASFGLILWLIVNLGFISRRSIFLVDSHFLCITANLYWHLLLLFIFHLLHDLNSMNSHYFFNFS